MLYKIAKEEEKLLFGIPYVIFDLMQQEILPYSGDHEICMN
jgi:hypothetical protein